MLPDCSVPVDRDVLLPFQGVEVVIKAPSDKERWMHEALFCTMRLSVQRMQADDIPLAVAEHADETNIFAQERFRHDLSPGNRAMRMPGKLSSSLSSVARIDS